ncbi:beta-propeller fold lactonase family protein [Streptomyces sp. TG1A-8]|uniref:YVTN family beta-propeller repeat protein n=1 Tax=Streptomyces sp. TG1A-8 TaxID=3051385 RepID=UPI00265C316D|nr:beta-propeller fold lactonase family protein [Streptomyces sp. TG1A-8]MDO0925635.1 beta-propeller fold lactonase family protein [Streptomyces sp. TG1A-8]
MRSTNAARLLAAGAALAALTLLSACGDGTPHRAGEARGSTAPDRPQVRGRQANALPGMPPVQDPADVYAADRPGRLSPVVRDFPARVYVPNTESDTVTVIDPRTYKVVGTIPVGRQPQHVVPSWDLRTLWVNNDLGNSLTPIDPRTGRAGTPVDVHDPYNLYFTPDGKHAVVMASMDRRLVFRDAHTMRVVRSVPVDCYGVNHADFSFDGRYFIVSCEFSGDLLKVDTARMAVVARQKLPFRGAMPQDVKISPDGKRFYVADMMANGLWILDGDAFTEPRFLATGKGAHGLYISRDSREMYVSNRGEGSVSVFDFTRGRLTRKWHLPGGGSPDMGGVSADGRVLWLSGRYDAEVYAIDTRTGAELARVKVGGGPHGLAVYPQPGRYSLGHTGIFR